jgi:probable rRNA maturation factor
MDHPAEPLIEVSVDHPTLSVDTAPLERLLPGIISTEGKRLEALSVVLTGHDLVTRLNRTHLEHDYQTDVLAFPLGDADDAVDGEVYVDLDTAYERHNEFGSSFDDEVYRYVIHGVLHLCGHQDDTAEGKSYMHKLEDAYLQRFTQT